MRLAHLYARVEDNMDALSLFWAVLMVWKKRVGKGNARLF
jgi:hypothetical protein